MKRLILIIAMLLAGPVTAAEVADATGRTVAVPGTIQRVLPGGPPAAVLLAAIAPAALRAPHDPCRVVQYNCL